MTGKTMLYFPSLWYKRAAGKHHTVHTLSCNDMLGNAKLYPPTLVVCACVGLFLVSSSLQRYSRPHSRISSQQQHEPTSRFKTIFFRYDREALLLEVSGKVTEVLSPYTSYGQVVMWPMGATYGCFKSLKDTHGCRTACTCSPWFLLHPRSPGWADRTRRRCCPTGV